MYSSNDIGRPWSAGPILRAVAIGGPLSEIRRSSSARAHHAQLARQRKTDMLFTHGPRLYRRAVLLLQVGDALFHHVLRRAGPGRDEYRLFAVEPLRSDLAHAVDQVGPLAATMGDFLQPLAVGAV